MGEEVIYDLPEMQGIFWKKLMVHTAYQEQVMPVESKNMVLVRVMPTSWRKSKWEKKRDTLDKMKKNLSKELPKRTIQ